MMRIRLACATLVVLLSTACAGRVAVPPGASVTITTDETAPPNWRAVATVADTARIGSIATNWDIALAAARTARRGQQDIGREGVLLDPDIALARPAPAPGRYWCRTVKVGSLQNGARRRSAITASKAMSCFVTVEGRMLSFSKPTGTDRPGGYLWDDGDTRFVFLGTQARDGRTAAPSYGAGAALTWAGVLERIGDFRWRLVLTSPQASTALTVIELTPDAPPLPVAPSG